MGCSRGCRSGSSDRASRGILRSRFPGTSGRPRSWRTGDGTRMVRSKASIPPPRPSIRAGAQIRARISQRYGGCDEWSHATLLTRREAGSSKPLLGLGLGTACAPPIEFAWTSRRPHETMPGLTWSQHSLESSPRLKSYYPPTAAHPRPEMQTPIGRYLHDPIFAKLLDAPVASLSRTLRRTLSCRMRRQ